MFHVDLLLALHNLLGSHVWRTLLVTLVVGKRSLVHVEAAVQVLQATVLHVLVNLAACFTWISRLLNLRVAAVASDGALVVVDVLRQKRALVQIDPLLHADVFLRVGVELDHHGAVELASVQGHAIRADVVQDQHPCLILGLR